MKIKFCTKVVIFFEKTFEVMNFYCIFAQLIKQNNSKWLSTTLLKRRKRWLLTEVL